MSGFLRRTWLLLASIALIAGCGVQLDSEPRALASDSLPADLLDAPAALPVTTDEDPAARIFMVGPDNKLTGVRRLVEFKPDASTQATLVVEALFAGTVPVETQAGITSAINRATEIESILAGDEGVVFVDLGEGSIVSLSGAEQELAYAQIVWTLTELPEFDRVVFSIADRFIGVPTDDGVSQPGLAVGRDAFPSLDPESRVGFLTDDEAIEPTPDATDPGDAVDGGADPVAPTPIPALPDDVPTVALPTVDPAVDLVVWMIDGDGNLTRRPRRIERSAESLMQSLLLGPALGEPVSGIRSAIPTSATLLNVDDDETGTAFVDLAPNSLPPAVDGDDRLRAVAQIVFTMTELAEITSVTILIGGERLPMPTQDGQSEPDARLERADYSALAPFVVGVQPVPVDPAPTVEIETPTPDLTPPPEATPGPELTPEPTATPDG